MALVYEQQHNVSINEVLLRPYGQHSKRVNFTPSTGMFNTLKENMKEGTRTLRTWGLEYPRDTEWKERWSQKERATDPHGPHNSVERETGLEPATFSLGS